jgi:hypothetical protein
VLVWGQAAGGNFSKRPSGQAAASSEQQAASGQGAT